MIFLAMDGPAVLTVPSGPVHHAHSEAAPKATNSSKSIITYSHHKLSNMKFHNAV